MAFSPPRRRDYVVFGVTALVLLVLRFATYQPANFDMGKMPVEVCVPQGQPEKPGLPCTVIEQVNREYVSRIKPIFAGKCLPCHGSVDRLPLYAAIPPVKNLVQHDLREAKEDFNMSYDFPFGGRGTLKQRLEAIQYQVDHHEMPPWFYLVMHWRSRLTSQEQAVLRQWIEESKKSL